MSEVMRAEMPLAETESVETAAEMLSAIMAAAVTEAVAAVETAGRSGEIAAAARMAAVARAVRVRCFNMVISFKIRGVREEKEDGGTSDLHLRGTLRAIFICRGLRGKSS